MRIMETDTTDNSIRNLKCTDETDRIRLTFQWPDAIEQVYIFKTGDVFDLETASPNDARLYTLQEYKKHAGFIDRKTPGIHTYRIYPFIRDEGEDVAIVQTDNANIVTCLAGQIVVHFSILEKRPLFGGDKINHIKLLSDQAIHEDVLCYVKKENGYPSEVTDGVVYFFDEPLTPGRLLERQIKTQKNEFIRVFVRDPGKASLYKLQMMPRA